ncbi:MAG: hypothetical protein MJ219_04000 [Mycoplasmoidaceae bacterium]|nr:hypothetical protein [Mycoplasmoidaceae bacterium]
MAVSETAAPTITSDSLADLEVTPESHSSTTTTYTIDNFATTNLTDAQKKSIVVSGGGELEGVVSAKSKDIE